MVAITQKKSKDKIVALVCGPFLLLMYVDQYYSVIFIVWVVRMVLVLCVPLVIVIVTAN